ncbi:hypothetical protein HPB47_002780, partial [Ixodes persulcatus]
PKDGSCDFDWGDACGYSVGNETGQWNLNRWIRIGTAASRITAVDVTTGFGAPKDGSCDFDWGDACGYNVGNETGQWNLNRWIRIGTAASRITAVDVTTGFGEEFVMAAREVLPVPPALLLLLLDDSLSSSCTSGFRHCGNLRQKLLSHSCRSCVEHVLAPRSRKRLRNDRGGGGKGIPGEVEFECSHEPGSYIGFYCAVDYVQLSDCSRPQANHNLDCDFEEGLCAWLNVEGDGVGRAEWTLGGGTTKTTLPKPSMDHTLKTANNGSYLFFSNFMKRKGTKAHVVSEAIISGSQATDCMDFWYIVAGDEGTKLRVIFEALAGFGGSLGYVALDDIKVYANESCETLPKTLPGHVEGDYIFASQATILENRGALVLTSPMVPEQTQPVCGIFRYHMFGALGAFLQISLEKNTGDGSPGSIEKHFFVDHRGRSRLCDFEYDTCQWNLGDASTGWKLQSNSLSGFHSHIRSGPPDSHSFLELQKNRATNDSVVTSPSFQGRTEAQCLKFWYRRDNVALGRIVVELVPEDGSQRNVLWEQPPYPKVDWMLARVPIAYQKEFQVVFKTNGVHPQNPGFSFGIDDLQLDPEPCRPLFECDFDEDLCGYVNDFQTAGLQWLVGTGRLSSLERPRRLSPPPSSSAEASRDIVSMKLTQVEYKDNTGIPGTLQTLDLPEGEGWQSVQLKLKPSKQSQVIVALTRGKGSDGDAAIGSISALTCDFEKGTFCGWEPSPGEMQFKLNDPANHVPPSPSSDHTLKAYK